MIDPPFQIDEHLILDESQKLLREGQYEAASILLEELLKVYPRSTNGMRSLAQIRMLQKRPQDAVPLLKRALVITKEARVAAESYKKSFGNEDAEYIEHEHRKQSDLREYDNSLTEASRQLKDRASPIAVATQVSFSAPNNLEEIKQELIGTAVDEVDQFLQAESAHRDSCANSDIQNLIGIEEKYTSSTDDHTSHGYTKLDGLPPHLGGSAIDASIELTVDDLLANEDSFIEQVIEQDIPTNLPPVIYPELFDQPGIEGLPATLDEDEWVTLDVADTAIEEDIWEGGLPPDAAIESLPTQLPDRLTRAERALQIAIKIGEEFDWDRDGIKLLAIIFDRYWWSSSQAAMRRAIESGMTPQELILAEEIRQIWYERPEFWSASNRLGEIYHQYPLISWPTALKLIRGFNGYPQSEEVEALLDNCLERWMDSIDLQRRFRGFYLYALYRVGAYDDLVEQDGWMIFDRYPTDEDEFVSDSEQTRRLHYLGVYIDPQAERYATRSWDGRLVLLDGRHGHDLRAEEDSQLDELGDKEDLC